MPSDSASPARSRLGPSVAGHLLRRWRLARGRSQLAFALDAGVSQRHISFIESGRSRPSRQMLLDLSQALDVPLRDRNSMLLAAGYAPFFPEHGLDAPQMGQIAKALRRMLDQHEPFPAIVMDRHWDVLMTNAAAPRFFSCFVDLRARRVRRNLLLLVFDPDGLRPFMPDWSEVAQSLLARLYREAGHTVDAEGRLLLEELARYPGVSLQPRAPATAPDLPMIPLTFRKDGTTLRYFSLVTTVGTAQAVSADDLRLECMFPADDETERLHAAFVAAHADPAREAHLVGRHAPQGRTSTERER